MAGTISREFRRHWRALCGATLGASIGTVGFFAYTGGVFFNALVAAGYSRQQLSLAPLILNVVIAVSAPFAGSLMDRYGALRIIVLAVLGEALGFALLGVLPLDFFYYVVGIMLLGLLGVGTTPPGFARIVTTRFDLWRGTALGLMISGPGLMAILAPIWMTWVIEWGGWRVGYWVMALVIIVFGGLGALLIASERTSEMPVAEVAAREKEDSDRSALLRPLFWVILLAFMAPGMFANGYLFHMISIMRERGFGAGDAAQVQALIGLAIVIGRLSSGAALDRFRSQRVAAAIFAISAAGCVAMLTSNPVAIAVAALAIGLTIGAEQDILAYFIGRYFGLASFGRLYGFGYSALIIASGSSTLVITTMAGLGGYALALAVSGVATFAGAAILLALPDPPPAAR